MQELGIPYKLLSTSEPHEPFRRFASMNHDSCHWHRTIGEQLQDAPCASHPESVECKVTTDKECHLLILGTPCNPFSTQRQKRFRPGSIMEHELSTHTFKDSYRMLSKVYPVNCVFEQTEGFDKPFDSTTTETPLQRPGVWVKKIESHFVVAFHFYQYLHTIDESMAYYGHLSLSEVAGWLQLRVGQVRYEKQSFTHTHTHTPSPHTVNAQVFGWPAGGRPLL